MIHNWEKFNEFFTKQIAPEGKQVSSDEEIFYRELTSKIQKNEADDFIIPYYKKVMEYCKANGIKRKDAIDVSTELGYGRKRSSFGKLAVFIEELSREHLSQSGGDFTEKTYMK